MVWPVPCQNQATLSRPQRPNHALQRTGTGDGVFSRRRALRRRCLSLSLSPLGRKAASSHMNSITTLQFAAAPVPLPVQIVSTLVADFVVFLLVVALFRWLWNITIPALFGLRPLTYWQAFRLLILAYLVHGLPSTFSLWYHPPA